ncbi:E3 ubiquitin-protein ligase Ufd4-like [Saccostrea cucullata]|uniref:E3 ubiquitin-protein ligase Ufd4-like n=1 Tax=Saccostrea cuccullata TaxID=36930 RepID=UPI002ED61415
MFVYLNEEHLEKEVYTERSDLLLAPGTRVRRGPNWHYDNQDSNGPGTVTGHWQRDGWIYVEWDTGMRFPYEYIEDSQEVNVIIPCDQPRILQRENIAVGCLVKRGPDWKWEDQDGGEGNIGAVYRVKEDTVYVRWPNGNKSNYRFGYGGKYDLVFCDPFDECLVISQKSNFMSTCTSGNKKGRTLFETREPSFKETGGVIDLEKSHQNDLNPESYEEQEGAILWQWKNELGRWKNFPKTEYQKIEKSFAKNSKSTILLAIDELMFRLVLSKMKLINISSRETYDVRRFENS